MRRGFTLIEMLTAIAGMVIVLGLMVSLADDVRSRSAETLTRQLLMRLDVALANHPELQPTMAKVPRLVNTTTGPYDEAAIQQAAVENNRAFVRIWRQATNGSVLRDQPLSVYDELTLRDAWGTPIAFMPAGAPNITIEPQSRSFFMSAGPDRKFTTADNNLYSYEHGAFQGPLH
ncbi:MAG TPA: type II secretion system protein [Tepidisphaeraceae bacterium]|nr:type II secretion system protein [Tepidisphaeraceae bacterium]